LTSDRKRNHHQDWDEMERKKFIGRVGKKFPALKVVAFKAEWGKNKKQIESIARAMPLTTHCIIPSRYKTLINDEKKITVGRTQNATHFSAGLI